MAMLTELEAINQILSVTGDAPVSSINSTYEQAVVARRILLEISKEIQAKGFWFNEVDEFLILKDSNGEINLPSETIRCDVPRDSGALIQRGLKLFNKKLNTYNIGSLSNDPTFAEAIEYFSRKTKMNFGHLKL